MCIRDRRYWVGYNAKANQFFSDRKSAGKKAFSEKFATKMRHAPRFSTTENVEMTVFFDNTSAELFADKGWTVMTNIFFPNEDFNQLDLKVVDAKNFVLHACKIDWF